MAPAWCRIRCGYLGSIHFAILTEVAGTFKYQPERGRDFDEEVDEVTGQSRMVVKIRPTKRNNRVSRFAAAAIDPKDLPDAGPRESDG